MHLALFFDGLLQNNSLDCLSLSIILLHKLKATHHFESEESKHLAETIRKGITLAKLKLRISVMSDLNRDAEYY